MVSWFISQPCQLTATLSPLEPIFPIAVTTESAITSLTARLSALTRRIPLLQVKQSDRLLPQCLLQLPPLRSWASSPAMQQVKTTTKNHIKSINSTKRRYLVQRSQPVPISRRILWQVTAVARRNLIRPRASNSVANPLLPPHIDSAKISPNANWGQSRIYPVASPPLERLATTHKSHPLARHCQLEHPLPKRSKGPEPTTWKVNDNQRWQSDPRCRAPSSWTVTRVRLTKTMAMLITGGITTQ